MFLSLLVGSNMPCSNLPVLVLESFLDLIWAQAAFGLESENHTVIKV